MGFPEEVKSNPWLAADALVKGRVGLAETASALEELLASDPKSLEFLCGLEFMKAVLALGGKAKAVELARALSPELLGTLSSLLTPEAVVEAYTEGFWKAMGMLAAWEYLALAGRAEDVVGKAIKLVELLAPRAEEDYAAVRDLARGLLEGVLASLSLEDALKVLEKVAELRDGVLGSAKFKAEALQALTSSVSASDLRSEELRRVAARLVAGVALTAADLLRRGVVEEALQLMGEVNAALQQLSSLCTELGSHDLCEDVRSRAEPALSLMYSRACEALLRGLEELKKG